MTNILAIESSCDETAVAVIRDGRTIVSSVVASQIDLHNKTGGVVPEIAARAHLEALPLVVEEAVSGLEGGYRAIDVVAVTHGPGLVGCLLAGVGFAQGIAASLHVPCVPVSHLAGHVYSAWLADQELEPPFVALLVSGGHSECVWVKEHGVAVEFFATKDDAAGEAFDKVARLIGLGYPGGPIIDHLARKGDPSRFSLPRTELVDGFSFSGLKTAVRYLVRDLGLEGMAPGGEVDAIRQDVAAVFQNRVIEQLVKGLERAVSVSGVRAVAVVGGVAANAGLRDAVTTTCKGLHVAIPPMELCTDNAAMIGAAGWHKWGRGEAVPLGFEVDPSLRIFA